ncbi:MAG: 50S ribosomal protein L11 methyltransferase [Flavobacteriales bacterium]
MPRQFLSIQLHLNPVLPAREVALFWLSEIGFDVFESEDWGLQAHGDLDQIDIDALHHVIQNVEAIADVRWEETRHAEKNWNAQWESNYEPINVDGRATMRAPFHPQPETGLDLIIQPAMSFGTGHHPTTYLMLKALLDASLQGLRVLDMGSGTGVLGIAAWKLGAKDVECIDIEERAKENGLENHMRNGGEADSDSVRFIQGGEEALLGSDRFDVILANINRNILMAQIDAYDRVAAENALIWTSGFFPMDVQVLAEHFSQWGWTLQQQLEKDGWSAVCWQKM